MLISWTPEGWDEYIYWQNADKAKSKKINFLIADIQKTPFKGLGKPEPLRFDLTGFWSRRIDLEHRLVYRIESGNIQIVSCKYHY
jgi:toxin YoeB